MELTWHTKDRARATRYHLSSSSLLTLISFSSLGMDLTCEVRICGCGKERRSGGRRGEARG
tara:strand:- start:848 stop:1030 length:183 start_codon:yes stop_codon:yes gene_type:complete